MFHLNSHWLVFLQSDIFPFKGELDKKVCFHWTHTFTFKVCFFSQNHGTGTLPPQKKNNQEIENLGSGPMFHFHDRGRKGKRHLLDALLETFQRVCKSAQKTLGDKTICTAFIFWIYIYIYIYIVCKGLPVHRVFCCENFREWSASTGHKFWWDSWNILKTQDP